MEILAPLLRSLRHVHIWYMSSTLCDVAKHQSHPKILAIRRDTTYSDNHLLKLLQLHCIAAAYMTRMSHAAAAVDNTSSTDAAVLS